MPDRIIVDANDGGVTEFALQVDATVKKSTVFTVVHDAATVKYKFKDVSHAIQRKPHGKWALLRMKTDYPAGGADEDGRLKVTATTGGVPQEFTVKARFRLAQKYDTPGTPTPSPRLMKRLFRPQELYVPVTGFSVVGGVTVKRAKGTWAVLNATQVPGKLRVVLCCTDSRVDTDLLTAAEKAAFKPPLKGDEIVVTVNPGGPTPPPPPPPMPVDVGFEEDDDEETETP